MSLLVVIKGPVAKAGSTPYLSKTIGIDENDEPRTVFEDTNYLSTFGYLTFDSFDNKFFPTKGFYLRGDFNFYFYANGTNKNFNEFSIIKAKKL